jgi:cyclophilin family peptidyl-prolyl cis-trans isomerase
LRYFARVSESNFIRVGKLAQTKQRVETSEELADEKEIVVHRYALSLAVLQPADNDSEVVDRERLFAPSGSASHTLASRQRFGDDPGTSVFTDVGEMVLKLVAYPREVRVYGIGFDVVTHVNRKQAQCLGRGLNGKIVDFAESYK